MKCKDCGVTDEILFYPNRKYLCKKCCKLRAIKWGKLHPEKKRESNRKYKAKPKIKEKIKRYNRSHKKETSIRFRKWYLKNRNKPSYKLRRLRQRKTAS